MSDEELRDKLKKLRATDPQEIGGRAGEVAALIEELLSLRRWKHEQLTVESWWQKVDTAVRAHPQTGLGRSVADAALTLIQERDEFEKLSKDAIALAEKCQSLYRRPSV